MPLPIALGIRICNRILLIQNITHHSLRLQGSVSLAIVEVFLLVVGAGFRIGMVSEGKITCLQIVAVQVKRNFTIDKVSNTAFFHLCLNLIVGAVIGEALTFRIETVIYHRCLSRSIRISHYSIARGIGTGIPYPSIFYMTAGIVSHTTCSKRAHETCVIYISA